MAYLSDLDRQCHDCDRRATVELITRWNSTFGYYCRRCGQRRLKQVQADEDKNGRA